MGEWSSKKPRFWYNNKNFLGAYMALFFKAVFLGIIEGITEFLPISSTGHLILADKFINLSNNPGFTNAFEVIIQLGAILAVIYLFWDRLWIFKGLKLKTDTLLFWLKIFFAVIPSAVLGFLFDDQISAKFFNIQTVAIALVVYGVAIILVERFIKNKKQSPANAQSTGWLTALGIGLFQCLALIPGTSRSAATIIGGLLLGLSRTAAAEFSFFLAIPTMCGAALLKLVKIGSLAVFDWLIILVGFVVSFLTAMIVVRLLMDYLQKHNFKIFGWYRIILGLIVLLLLK